MSDRNEQIGKADGDVAIRTHALADMRYMARTSPPIPDTAMQEARQLIEANSGNARQWPIGGRGCCDWHERQGLIIQPHQQLRNRAAPIQHHVAGNCASR